MTDEQTPRWLRRSVLAGLLGGLLWLGFVGAFNRLAQSR